MFNKFEQKLISGFFGKILRTLGVGAHYTTEQTSQRICFYEDFFLHCFSDLLGCLLYGFSLDWLFQRL
jgi:hypothetical protein